MKFKIPNRNNLGVNLSVLFVKKTVRNIKELTVVGLEKEWCHFL
jgi:hypothetical protein